MTELDSTVADISNSCRWTAPEILQPPEEDEEESLSAIRTRATDVYAFGMTVLEVMNTSLHIENILIIIADLHGEKTLLQQASRSPDCSCCV